MTLTFAQISCIISQSNKQSRVMQMSQELILTVGNTYRAKKPCRAGQSSCVNDRTIIWMSMGGSQIQYDGPAVGIGAKYPTVSREAFLAWAERNVTSELPEGQYAPWPIKKTA
jgi:hypothetical protein